MAEPSRKRTFQARELVWSTFETMARERGANVDELVQEAMAAYATARGYVVDRIPEPRIAQRELEETQDGRSVSPLDRSYQPPANGAYDDDLARTNARSGAAAGPDEFYDSETRTRPRYMPGTPGQRPPSRLPPPNAPPGALAGRPAPSGRTQPGPSAGRGAHTEAREARGASPAKRLVLTYEGRSYPVERDRFLLGRSKTQADLRLDDPNVSRQHAVIELVGASWYIVDLGSTNGVIIGGERVARRPLADGDVIVITAHEIRCSLR
jgi:hypothetical protein